MHQEPIPISILPFICSRTLEFLEEGSTSRSFLHPPFPSKKKCKLSIRQRDGRRSETRFRSSFFSPIASYRRSKRTTCVPRASEDDSHRCSFSMMLHTPKKRNVRLRDTLGRTVLFTEGLSSIRSGPSCSNAHSGCREYNYCKLRTIVHARNGQSHLCIENSHASFQA